MAHAVVDVCLLGGRRVDLLPTDSDTELQPIHGVALTHGVPP